jgi:hypothetical protein
MYEGPPPFLSPLKKETSKASIEKIHKQNEETGLSFTSRIIGLAVLGASFEIDDTLF